MRHWPFFCTRLLSFFPSRMEHIIIKVMAKCTVSSYRFPKAAQRDAMCTSVLLYIVIREKYILLFPRRLPRTVSHVKGHHGADLDSFLSVSWFFFPIVTTLLCCSTDFPAVLLLQCLKSNSENEWLNSSETSSRSWQAWENHENTFVFKQNGLILYCLPAVQCVVLAPKLHKL